MIVVASSTLQRKSANIVAIVLAHEAAHLRIGALFSGSSSNQVRRIERRCVGVSSTVANMLALSVQEQTWLSHHIDEAKWTKSSLSATISGEDTGIRIPRFIMRFAKWLREPTWHNPDAEG
jgi:hypothetical protein